MSQAMADWANKNHKLARDICEGRFKLVKEYKPARGECVMTTMAGQIQHKALMDTVVIYLESTIRRVRREEGLPPLSDEVVHRAAVHIRDENFLVDA